MALIKNTREEIDQLYIRKNLYEHLYLLRLVEPEETETINTDRQ